MGNNPFDIARQAFASLELFRGFHASGPGYQAHHDQVISLLRASAANIRATKPQDADFYDGLAAALLKLNGQK